MAATQASTAPRSWWPENPIRKGIECHIKGAPVLGKRSQRERPLAASGIPETPLELEVRAEQPRRRGGDCWPLESSVYREPVPTNTHSSALTTHSLLTVGGRQDNNTPYKHLISTSPHLQMI